MSRVSSSDLHKRVIHRKMSYSSSIIYLRVLIARSQTALHFTNTLRGKRLYETKDISFDYTQMMIMTTPMTISDN